MFVYAKYLLWDSPEKDGLPMILLPCDKCLKMAFSWQSVLQS